jgi:ABC-type transport system involved in multi-copper enzyme maturation permease subunit
MQSAASLPTSAPARARYDEPVWRRALDWFERSNALAAREVRMALRSPRAWLLLSLYISVLGAVVLAQFPADTTVEMWAGNAPANDGYGSGYGANIESSRRGQELLAAFTWAQFFGVWLLVPSLAVGALHQEREGQTLESLLLSPLSPLQIVWGKLCGVLAMASVLLLGTLPLTSLCFLLGGVAPEDVAIRFFGLLAWAMFAAGIGCTARRAPRMYPRPPCRHTHSRWVGWRSRS